MDCIEAIKTRRSIRTYKPDCLPDNIINTILDAGVRAPSTKNTQFRRLIAIKGIENIDKLTKIVKTATINAEKSEEIIYKNLVANPKYTINYGAPLFVIALADSTVGNPEADCSVMLENMFLASHSVGVGSVWINQLNPISDTIEIRAFLDKINVPKSYKIYGCGAFGYNSCKHPNPIDIKQDQIIIIENI